jgi:hypothetical protein
MSVIATRFIRHSLDEPLGTARMLAFCQIPPDPSIWPFPSSFRSTPPVVMIHLARSVLSWGRSWSQSADQPQDLLEQFSRRRDLGHLE